MEAAEIAKGLSAEERALLSKGDDLRLFLPFLKTKKLVGETFFKPGVLIDSSYQDFASLEDPMRSDMPAMKRLAGIGLLDSLGSDWVGFSPKSA